MLNCLIDFSCKQTNTFSAHSRTIFTTAITIAPRRDGLMKIDENQLELFCSQLRRIFPCRTNSKRRFPPRSRAVKFLSAKIISQRALYRQKVKRQKTVAERLLSPLNVAGRQQRNAPRGDKALTSRNEAAALVKRTCPIIKVAPNVRHGYLCRFSTRREGIFHVLTKKTVLAPYFAVENVTRNIKI